MPINKTKQKNGKNQLPEVVRLDPELNELMLNHFTGEKDGFVQIGPKKWFYPMKYEQLADQYLNFRVRSNDIWVMGFPRSGTTVTQELVWLLSHDLDFEKAKVDLGVRVPFFEANILLNDKTKNALIKENENDKNFPELFDFIENTLQILDRREERRVIKTHLPFELLSQDILDKGCKVVFVCRYPKDVEVSFYHLQSSVKTIGFKGDFKTHWNFFQNNMLNFTPYFELIKQAYEKRSLPNVFFVFYEELNKEPRKFIKKMAEFLEKDLSNEDIDKLEKYLKFDNFKKNESVNKECMDTSTNFIRQGQVGGWTKYFSAEMNVKADRWIKENFEKIGIEFPDYTVI